MTGAACGDQVSLFEYGYHWRSGCATPSWIAPPDEEQTLSHWHTLHQRGSAPADAAEDYQWKALSDTRERPMDPRPHANDERLTMITVELPEVVVAGTTGARHRARCVLFDESKRAAPLQPGDVVLVRRVSSRARARRAGQPAGLMDAGTCCWTSGPSPPAPRCFTCSHRDDHGGRGDDKPIRSAYRATYVTKILTRAAVSTAPRFGQRVRHMGMMMVSPSEVHGRTPMSNE